MNTKAIHSASRDFLSTRAGFVAYPTIRVLIRHIEASTRLAKAFDMDATATRIASLQFAFWRSILVVFSEMVALFDRARRRWRPL